MNNDFFSQNQTDTEPPKTEPNGNNKPYIPLSYEEALKQRANQKRPDTSGYSYPRLERAASILRIISYILAGIVILLYILGSATDGAVFSYAKTEGVVTDCDSEYYGSLLNRTQRYIVTVEYEYNGETGSAQFSSSMPKYKEQTVDVYVNIYNSNVICFDSRFGSLSLISPIIFFIVCLWALSSVMANYGRFRLNLTLGMGPRIRF